MGSSIQKFGFINGVDNVNWPPYRDSKSFAFVTVSFCLSLKIAVLAIVAEIVRNDVTVFVESLLLLRF